MVAWDQGGLLLVHVRVARLRARRADNRGQWSSFLVHVVVTAFAHDVGLARITISGHRLSAERIRLGDRQLPVLTTIEPAVETSDDGPGTTAGGSAFTG